MIFVRSPTITKLYVSSTFNGSNPLKLGCLSTSFGIRGLKFPTALAIDLICLGVVPQQPPHILESFFSANSP